MKTKKGVFIADITFIDSSCAIESISSGSVENIEELESTIKALCDNRSAHIVVKRNTSECGPFNWVVDRTLDYDGDILK